MHALPVAGAAENGMFRIVACVSFLIAVSQSAAPHQGDRDGRPSSP
jgi:hypothetical protein